MSESTEPVRISSYEQLKTMINDNEFDDLFLKEAVEILLRKFKEHRLFRTRTLRNQKMLIDLQRQDVEQAVEQAVENTLNEAIDKIKEDTEAANIEIMKREAYFTNALQGIINKLSSKSDTHQKILELLEDLGNDDFNYDDEDLSADLDDFLGDNRKKRQRTDQFLCKLRF